MEIQRIQLQQLANTRDLAGMPAEGQRAIRAGRLLRSGELWGANPEDVRRLQTEHNLRVVVDFRTLKEQQERPDPAISGVRYISLPILSNEAMGVTHEKKADQDVMKMLMGSLENVEFDSKAYMAGLYRKLLESDFSRNQYGEFLKFCCSVKTERCFGTARRAKTAPAWALPLCWKRWERRGSRLCRIFS